MIASHFTCCLSILLLVFACLWAPGRCSSENTAALTPWCSLRYLLIMLLMLLMGLAEATGSELAVSREQAPTLDKPHSKERPLLVMQLGHSKDVTSIAFSSDERLLATGSSDGTARLWNVDSGREVHVFRGHEDNVSITSVAFSPDGRFLATGSLDDTARLWNVTTGAEVRCFTHGDSIWDMLSRQLPHATGQYVAVTDVAFSPDGRFLVTSSEDGTARLWGVESGAEVRRFTHRDGIWDAFNRQLRRATGQFVEITSVDFSPDGRLLATGSADGTARLWDVTKGTEVRVYKGQGGDVQSVAFSPDGRFLATGSEDKIVRLWGVASGAEVKRIEVYTDETLVVRQSKLLDIPIPKLRSSIRSLSFSPDGRVLATVSGNGSARLWEVASGMEVQVFAGHVDWAHSVAFSPDGRFLATGDWKGSARLWNVASGTKVRHFEGYLKSVTSVAFSPDSRLIATGSVDRTVRLWNAAGDTEVQVFAGYESGVGSVAFSPDGRFLATGNREGIRLWDVSGTQVRIFAKHAGWVRSVAFSPDGYFLVTGGMDGTARVWDVASGEEVRAFKGNYVNPAGTVVAVSPDGNLLAIGDGDRTARLWDVASGEEIHVFTGHETHILSMAFSPDGRFLATGDWKSSARLWDVASGELVRVFGGYDGGSYSVAFSPDGHFLATSGEDGSVRLWDVENGEQLRVFEGHSGRVNSMAFSPDGRFLLTGSNDGRTILWDAHIGKQLASLVSFPDNTWAVIDADGRYDSNSPRDLPGVSWVTPGYPFSAVPIEAFMQDYYTPQLLPRLMKGVAKDLR